MNVKQKLIEARALIADPANWTQRRYARNKRGHPVDYDSQRAVSFCAAGACFKVADILNVFGGETGMIGSLNRQLPADFTELTIFNDNSTHDEVLALFDRAIEACDDGEK